jgi:Icc-related predicted phosphoesterase
MNSQPTLRIIVVGDPHGRLDRFAAALDLAGTMPVDLVLIPGDLVRDPAHRHQADLAALVRQAAERWSCPVAYVPGNHDLPVNAPVAAGIDLDGRVLDVAGLRIAGTGGAGPNMFGFPYEWSEEQVALRLERLTPNGPLDIWLCHTPPRNCELDQLTSGGHVGSIAVRSALNVLRPKLFVCGHIHEAAGIADVDGVLCLNAGALGEPYSVVRSWWIEWDRGPVAIGCYSAGATQAAAKLCWVRQP